MFTFHVRGKFPFCDAHSIPWLIFFECPLVICIGRKRSARVVIKNYGHRCRTNTNDNGAYVLDGVINTEGRWICNKLCKWKVTLNRQSDWICACSIPYFVSSPEEGQIKGSRSTQLADNGCPRAQPPTDKAISSNKPAQKYQKTEDVVRKCPFFEAFYRYNLRFSSLRLLIFF